jgi:phosphate-selective porin OprO and OprP
VNSIKYLILLGLIGVAEVNAQELIKEKKNLIFQDGINFSHDQNFFTRVRFRMQNRLEITGKDNGSVELSRTEFIVRRTRLRFDGHAMNGTILYRLQFSFTRGDQDWDNSQVPNVIRDAVFGHEWRKGHTLWFGLAKLPGNRQRVISSGAQQFADRSQLNALFNIDRDVGVQHYSVFNPDQPIWLKFAVSNGQGRNQPNESTDMAYTSRIEWYPRGKFNDDGDNFEADLFREKDHKIGFGLAHSYNKSTRRTAGQLGATLPKGEERNIKTTFFDFLYKHQGKSLSVEYANRSVDNPIINNDLFMLAGQAINIQGGILNESNVELALRYTLIKPRDGVLERMGDEKLYTVGVNKYINNHVFKIQGDLTYRERAGTLASNSKDNFELRLQVEFGI